MFSVGAVMFAFTVFANFEDLLGFVGFFEFLIDSWTNVLDWLWRYLFSILQLDIELSAIEQKTATACILIFGLWSLSHVLYALGFKAPETNLSYENIVRILLAIPGILFLIFSWNVSFYQMSGTATVVAICGMIIALFPSIIVLMTRPPTTPEAQANIIRIHLMCSTTQIFALAFTAIMYVIAKLISLAPAF